MADVKWIKITTDIFSDEKILLIEQMPEADTMIVIWFKLLCMAGRDNNNGIFLMNNRVPYTEEMLATLFRRPLSVVRMAISTFEAFGMIEIIDDVIMLPNWEKHQNLDGLERIKEQNRIRKQRQRERQRLVLEDKSHVTSRDGHATDKDKEEDKDKEKDNTITVSKETVCLTDVRRIVDAWNELEAYGIKKISKLTTTSTRYKSLMARIKQYSVDDVLAAIDRIKQSDFLQGSSRKGWVITFDWFVCPNNFPKVLEGNYDNTTARTYNGKTSAVEQNDLDYLF